MRVFFFGRNLVLNEEEQERLQNVLYFVVINFPHFLQFLMSYYTIFIFTSIVERLERIELSSVRWRRTILPLNDRRIYVYAQQPRPVGSSSGN